MKKTEDELEDKSVSDELSNINELMSVTKPFSSAQYARDILVGTKNGEVNPLDAMIVVKRFEKVAKICLEDQVFKDLASDEADKYLSGSTKSFEKASAIISKGATYTIFDFSECGHSELDALYKIEAEVKVHIKNLEDELKLLVPKAGSEDFSIKSDKKEVLITKIPFLNWASTEDQVTVKAPQKFQRTGLKFNKV